jgi:uncharacterized glyoxalase superfamily protein PhnB
MADETLRFEAVTPILSVEDLQSAIGWFQDVLGFQTAWVWEDPPALASVCRDQVELNLGVRGRYGPEGPSHVYLRVAPVDTVWERVLASGAELVAPLADRPYGLRDFGVRDASGNRLDFGEPLREGEVRGPQPRAPRR